MKKLLYFCASMALVSVIFLFGFNIYEYTQDNNTKTYSRFFATDSTGTTHFNWCGILSPIQTESQRIVTDTMRFTHKVIYPYGKNFQCIPPEDSTAEQFVASQIAQVINDSIEKVRFNLSLDYDRTALSVRKWANPATRQLAKPTVILSLLGTASPEARKYGFKESLMPNHYEPENDTLASQRLDRTATILGEKGFPATIKSSQEIQFPDTASALIATTNPSLLDSMRYVQADIVVPVERLEITPATAPVLLSLWLWLSVLGLVFLWNLRLPKLQRPKIEWGVWSWSGIWEFLKILFYCVGTAVLLTSLLFLSRAWLQFLLFLCVFAIALCILYLLWRYRDVIWWYVREFFFFIFSIFLFLWKLLVSIWNWIVKMWGSFMVCWSALPLYWRRVLVAVVLYAVFATYKWLSCPC